MRLRQRSKVDFPQPEGPMTAVTEQSANSRVTFRRTRVPPNHASRRRVRKSGSVSAAIVATSRCVFGDETDDEDDGDEDGRSGPGLCVRGVVRTDGIGDCLLYT